MSRMQKFSVPNSGNDLKSDGSPPVNGTKEKSLTWVDIVSDRVNDN